MIIYAYCLKDLFYVIDVQLVQSMLLVYLLLCSFSVTWLRWMYHAFCVHVFLMFVLIILLFSGSIRCVFCFVFCVFFLVGYMIRFLLLSFFILLYPTLLYSILLYFYFLFLFYFYIYSIYIIHIDITNNLQISSSFNPLFHREYLEAINLYGCLCSSDLFFN